MTSSIKTQSDAQFPEEKIDIPEVNFGQFILERLRKYGASEALVNVTTDETFTYNDVSGRIERLASGLTRAGLGPGDILAIVAPNCVDYPVSFVAVTAVGAVFQPLNPLYTQEDLRRAFESCGTKFIITTDELTPKVVDAADGLSIKIINGLNSTQTNSADNTGCIAFKSLLANDVTDFASYPCNPRATTGALFSSSGTTGLPKSVEISHYALIANIQQIFVSNPFPVEDRILVFLPLYHAYGLNIVTALSLAYGARVAIISKFNPIEYMKLIAKHKITTLHVVPPLLVMFAKNPAAANFDLSSVRKVFCGAAPLSPEIETASTAVLKLDMIHQGYAMTETGVTCINRDGRHRTGSCGQRLTGIDVKIVSVDKGDSLELGKEGEIMIRGPQNALGYLHLPEQSAAVFTADGWVHTGDVGKLDADGFLYITDRLKELIKYKGFQVPPAQLEDILLKHAGIRDVAVVGVPDVDAGELPRAFVVCRTEGELTEDDIAKFVEDRVAPHMRLRGGVKLVSEIPKSASGKILRRLLKDKH